MPSKSTKVNIPISAAVTGITVGLKTEMESANIGKGWSPLTVGSSTRRRQQQRRHGGEPPRSSHARRRPLDHLSSDW